MTKPRQQSPLAILKELKVFRTSDAIKAGISQPTLSRLAAAGELIRLEHGLYQHPKAKINHQDLDLAIACARFGPDAAIGGLTALYKYQLISEVPDRIWLIVPQSTKSTSPLYRCLRTTTDTSLEIVDKGSYRMATLERSVLEALRHATKFGLSLGLKAARTALEEGKTTESKLYAAATTLNLQLTLAKYWEAIVP